MKTNIDILNDLESLIRENCKDQIWFEKADMFYVREYVFEDSYVGVYVMYYVKQEAKFERRVSYYKVKNKPDSAVERITCDYQPNIVSLYNEPWLYKYAEKLKKELNNER